MAVSFLTGFLRLRNAVADWWCWLLRVDSYVAFDQSEIAKYCSQVDKDVDAANRAEDEQRHYSNVAKKRIELRTINYWSFGGHFYQWRYTPETMKEAHADIATKADDRELEFSWDDAVRVHEIMVFMELARDCQDVVGW